MAAVRKNTGAGARKGRPWNLAAATRAGRYAEIAPAKSIRTPMTRTTVWGFAFCVNFSDRKEPAATPARKVESRRAKAGARSAEAMAKTRNQAISNPSAMKPDSPARSMAMGSWMGESLCAACGGAAGAMVEALAGRRPYR